MSLWRGVPIDREQVALTAEVVDANGKVVERLKRDVRFVNTAVRAELIRAQSRLVADGVTRPVIALRLTDAAGRPVHHGLAGDFTLPAPYYAAIEADAQQARQLAGLERARPTWRVSGDDGIALVELEPTTASGSLALRFSFRDGQRVRQQRLEAWLEPGARDWTVVGLAEGTVGFNRLDKHLETLGEKDDKTTTDGRLALYAKGRIKGRWLLTLAYDSDKKRDDSRFAGVIDPTAYYTVYADRSEQRYDASSLRKLYLKLERPQFYALFGDYDTAIDEPVLTRYVRALNGAKAEYRSERVSALAFASDTPTRHRRDEIQGNGLSGPYVLAGRNLLANSERIVIETRDRLRSDRIVDRHPLTRHIDYDIDYAAGTLRFREPILSRSSAGDPMFIVADYEVDGIADRTLNAGGRIAVRSADQKLQVAATAIRDADEAGETDVGGVDLRYRPTAATEIRAEAAVSRTRSGRRRGNHQGVAARGRASRRAARRAGLRLAARRGLRPAPHQRGRKRHAQDRHRRPRRPHQDAAILRQRVARGQPDLRRAPHRRPRLARISRPGDQRARRARPRRRPPGRWPRGDLDPAPARRHPALVRGPPRARCADRTSDLRPGREHRLPGPPQARRALLAQSLGRARRQLRDRQRRRHPLARRAHRLRPRAVGRGAHRAQRQRPGHRRIWPAQLRRLRPVAVAGRVEGTDDRRQPRQQPHDRRDRPRPRH